MGVSGAGKTSVGQQLASELGWTFADADDYHSAANVAKMHAGIPLNDDDRAPWLETLAGLIRQWIACQHNAILACSALKQRYRSILEVGPEVRLVFLRGSFDLISERLSHRTGHYMNPTLLQSQFEALEEPADATIADITLPVDGVVANIRQQLGI